ncbi:ERF family protein [Bradyrhizobium sp.]|uniref:ERF family protein n=1 Tax=Bradyrhizobium sp. TaxID=376 RepID=UPI002734BD7C|nr:ERF family protein [Bradyrhizobium sp.]MDP3078669.1 ERF family protein [Bradyrhizobium sp.]
MQELKTTGEDGGVIAALIKVQEKLEPLRANAKSHHGGFANLHQVMQTLQPHLTANRLAVVQVPASSASGSCTVLTRIIHADKSEITSTITIPMQRANDPQAYGAAMTYARRYALLCMFAMVTEDDDAASASISLEKLLREMSATVNIEELNKIKGEHFDKGLLTDKFWNRTYNVIFEMKYRALENMNQEKAA